MASWCSFEKNNYFFSIALPLSLRDNFPAVRYFFLFGLFLVHSISSFTGSVVLYPGLKNNNSRAAENG